MSWNSAGWFASGTMPEDVGSALNAGQLDVTSGPAVFARSGTITASAKVDITRVDGSRPTFVVDGGESDTKSERPTVALSGPTPLRELRHVTVVRPAPAHHLESHVAIAHLAV